MIKTVRYKTYNEYDPNRNTHYYSMMMEIRVDAITRGFIDFIHLEHQRDERTDCFIISYNPDVKQDVYEKFGNCMLMLLKYIHNQIDCQIHFNRAFAIIRYHKSDCSKSQVLNLFNVDLRYELIDPHYSFENPRLRPVDMMSLGTYLFHQDHDELDCDYAKGEMDWRLFQIFKSKCIFSNLEITDSSVILEFHFKRISSFEPYIFDYFETLRESNIFIDHYMVYMYPNNEIDHYILYGRFDLPSHLTKERMFNILKYKYPLRLTFGIKI